VKAFGQDLVVVTGKGGVGKSTVAAALGLAAARRGLRTVVAEVAARDDVSRVLAGSGTRPFEERAVADGLFHISIDPERAMEEYLVDQLPVRALADVLTSSRLFTYLAAATPGMRELLTMGKVWELAQGTRRTPGARPYDLVVLDAPATGHGVAVLAAPRTFAEAARVGPVARQGRTIHEMVVDPGRTGVIAVATAEEMPVNETLALRETLQDDLGLGLDAVVVNAVLPDRFTAQDGAALAVRPGRATRIAASLHARAGAQAAQLARLRSGLGGDVPVRTLPFLFAPEIGAAELAALAAELGR
jgi:anion-transporting  ArsA/GET3 family ATPase